MVSIFSVHLSVPYVWCMEAQEIVQYNASLCDGLNLGWQLMEHTQHATPSVYHYDEGVFNHLTPQRDAIVVHMFLLRHVCYAV